jgi:hypothetical protein
MDKVLIASTYLHLIDSLIIQKQFNNSFHLVFIGKKNTIFDLIKNEFKSYLFLEEKKDKNKIQQRIKNYQILNNYIKEISPNEIIIGNDRKIETAILIANNSYNYSYMDDGLHSYILEKQHILKYSFFEKKLKEFIYKNSLVLPKFIGCANYIKKAYLFRPNLAHKLLKNKTLIKLQPDIEYLKNVFNPLIDKNTISLLQKATKIIFLPHPKFITKEKIDKINRFIDKNTLIKLHPRDNTTKINGIILQNLFSEIIFLYTNAKIYGFNTTSLLTAKWLREDLEVFYFFEKNELFDRSRIEYISLFSK